MFEAVVGPQAGGEVVGEPVPGCGISGQVSVPEGGAGGEDVRAEGGGYADTDIGKVITAAYFNAFVDLIRHMQGGQVATGAQASANAGVQAYTAKSAVVLRKSPSPQAAAVRSFAVGELVYPTGQKNGIWWEVDDENGNRGWVSSAFITPRN